MEKTSCTTCISHRTLSRWVCSVNRTSETTELLGSAAGLGSLQLTPVAYEAIVAYVQDWQSRAMAGECVQQRSGGIG